jgi:MFS transporter, FHS family, L-fucose permease
MFYPASQLMVYGYFLAALFILAAGLSILETSANPFVIAMGPEGNATRRLNLAQAFNPVGTNLGVLLATALILPKLNAATSEERTAMSAEQLRSTRRNRPSGCRRALPASAAFASSASAYCPTRSPL